jgi:hypothetical protein
MIDFDSDLIDMLSLDEFSVPATVGLVTVNGIFTKEYETKVLLGLDIEGSSAVFTCRTSEVSGAARGDTVTILTVAYRVDTIEYDGTGVSMLILSEV